MAGINGLIFLIAGGAVAITAYLVDLATLKIFFLAGIVLAVYGLGKFLIQRALYGGKDKKKTEQIMKTPVQKVDASKLRTIKYCPQCSKAHGESANYCINCGTKL